MQLVKSNVLGGVPDRMKKMNAGGMVKPSSLAMALKMKRDNKMPVKYTPFIALNAADASTNQTSVAIDTREDVYISVHNISTGTATGTVKLQASNDSITSARHQPTGWIFPQLRCL